MSPTSYQTAPPRVGGVVILGRVVDQCEKGVPVAGMWGDLAASDERAGGLAETGGHDDRFEGACLFGNRCRVDAHRGPVAIRWPESGGLTRAPPLLETTLHPILACFGEVNRFGNMDTPPDLGETDLVSRTEVDAAELLEVTLRIGPRR